MQTRDRWIVALVSFTLVALEVVWTRIFSAQFFYTFAFLMISLAVLGLGLGALATRVVPFLARRRPDGPVLLTAAFFGLAGPPLVLRLGLNFSALLHSPVMMGLFAGVVVLLSLPFFCAGIVVALIFRTRSDDMPRLYMFDMAGAALGALLAVLGMNWFSTPAAAPLATVPLLAAAILARRRFTLASGLLAACAAGAVWFSWSLMNPPREERAPVIAQHWDAMAKLKVYKFADDYRGINIDNAANTPVLAFDGNWNRPDTSKFEFGIDISYFIKSRPATTFLSLGAGGGGDVLQALQEGAGEIHAVEVNPAINKMMVEGDLAEFSGRIYHDPRVRVITEDARTYIRRFTNKFDVIFSLSSNTFAALASGSFALAENYLFTTEAFADYYTALTEDGFLVMEHQFYVPRLAGEAMDALAALSVNNPADHIAVYNLPALRRNVLLVGKQPLTDEVRRNALGGMASGDHARAYLLFPAADSIRDNTVNMVITSGWREAQAGASIDLSPCADNRPFTPQLGLWKNVRMEKLADLKPWEFQGFPLSRLIIVAVLAVLAVFIVPLNLLPYLLGGPRLHAAPWIYFFLIGAGFMAIEVVLIQQFALLIGPPTYSFIAILLSLLLGAGMGSRLALHMSAMAPFAAIICWILADILLFPTIASALSGLPLVARIVAAATMIFPVGFFMGMPFPKGAVRVGELIDWGFAVNGAGSVVGSTVVLLVAFQAGLNAGLGMAACAYAGALVLYGRNNWGSQK